MDYDHYNREERAACAHLFRLLHERLAATPEESGLARVLRTLRRGLPFEGLGPQPSARGGVVLTEVALIRDAYQNRKPDVGSFMDALVSLVAEQEGIVGHRSYTALPSPLSDPRLTHPKQIAHKGAESGLLSGEERRVYGAVQGMFNAKPDLAVVLSSCLIVVEAKLTERFDGEQLARTRAIAQVWARLLHRDLGFDAPPPFAVALLGDEATDGVHLTWQAIAEVARSIYPENDRSRIALEAAARLGEARSLGGPHVAP